MSSRIHDCLDGKCTRDDLSPEERVALDALQATLASVAGPLCSVSAPDVSGHVLARIAEAERQPARFGMILVGARSALQWLWDPRPILINVRRAYALGAMGIVAFSVFVAQAILSNDDVAITPQVFVQFRLDNANASRVSLAGSFTDWRPAYEMHETSPGTWSIVVPLEPGVHDYAFIVNGTQWVADPNALQIADGFGGANSRIALPIPVAKSKQL